MTTYVETLHSYQHILDDITSCHGPTDAKGAHFGWSGISKDGRPEPQRREGTGCGTNGLLCNYLNL